MNKPLVIAGPCSAESEKQVMDAVRIARDGGAECFRAGVWKPRSHPGSFQGAGNEALTWMKKASELLPVCTEVASEEHVKRCLDAGIVNLWIGARTTTNPFLVQEIADALSGREDVRVMVKNPVSPDCDLWEGAVERLQKAGIRNIDLIHRGFFSRNTLEYRNAPMWEVALQMRRRHPSLPLICDPSHICGDAAKVEEVASRAMALGFDGLMVEVHPDPEHALSDAPQQLDAEGFSRLMESISIRLVSSDDDAVNERLSVLRGRIDSIDAELISLLGERMSVSRQIGECKQQAGIAIHQPSRWEEVMRSVRELASREGLPQASVEKIFEEIHCASVREQK